MNTTAKSTESKDNGQQPHPRSNSTRVKPVHEEPSNLGSISQVRSSNSRSEEEANKLHKLTS